MTGPTVADTLNRAVAVLRDRSESPRADALLLLARALGCRREYLLAHDDAPVTAECGRHFAYLCEARRLGTPVAYLLGEAGFYGRRFSVDERVMVPRPETECLVDEALAFLRRADGGPAVLDVGCGSGAIACTVAAEIPGARVAGTDSSPDALAVARENARSLGVGERCAFLRGDLAEPVRGRRFDAAIANLPYVPTDALPRKPDPVGFEPRGALDGGRDGLEPYRRFLPAAPALLKPGGLLLLEAAPAQMAALSRLAAGAFGGAETSVGADLSGRERYVAVRAAG